MRVLGKDFALKGGDTINVERAPVFYIYGEVTRSGAYRVEPNMTVMQAIAAGGGITPRGSDRRLKLRRARRRRQGGRDRRQAAGPRQGRRRHLRQRSSVLGR